LSAEGPGTCPRCGGACGEGSLWEEILLVALKHGASARFAAGPQKLARHGGVVAVLPQAATPAAVSG